MIGTELLDDPHAEPGLVRRELADIATLNTLFGGTRAVVRALEPIFDKGKGEAGRGMGATWTLLDIGTGLGDIPRAAAKAARRHGITLRTIGVELNRAAAAAARDADGGDVALVLADGNALPLAPRSVDVVIASQVLHHLPAEVAARWIATCNTLARRAVVLADLRRSRVAMAALWLVSFPLGFDATTRHDGVLSLRRGYTRGEFNALLRDAGAPPVARYRPGFRVVAAWEP
ncbi:MAG TPA: methyltransferase domain-containing protein [Gemmatimonadales bacterium]|nr:methyltransferase domain-containing protein [Gemmatimonadales bacterium]